MRLLLTSIATGLLRKCVSIQQLSLLSRQTTIPRVGGGGSNTLRAPQPKSLRGSAPASPPPLFPRHCQKPSQSFVSSKMIPRECQAFIKNINVPYLLDQSTTLNAAGWVKCYDVSALGRSLALVPVNSRPGEDNVLHVQYSVPCGHGRRHRGSQQGPGTPILLEWGSWPSQLFTGSDNHSDSQRARNLRTGLSKA